MRGSRYYGASETGAMCMRHLGKTPPFRGPHGNARRSVAVRRLGVLSLGGSLLAALAASSVLFRRDLAAARGRLANVSSETYASGHGEIEYRLVGSGPTLLISHGITGGVDQAESLVKDWRQLREDYRFLYVSRFGYLRSDAPERATAREQAATYRALLDHLGIEQVFLVGNSAGGAAAMWFTIDNPRRTDGLILLSSAVPGPVPKPMPRLVAEHDFIYWAAVKLAPDMLLGLLLPDPVRDALTREQKRFAIEHAFMAALPISERSAGIALDYVDSIPGINELPFERITVPTLIVQASDDPRELAGAEEMARRIPDSHLLTLSGGHFLLGHEQEIQAATADFIAAHTHSDARGAR
jgi:2-hydroxy-6-oxonona-2,4-dienedioate hydrolase